MSDTECQDLMQKLVMQYKFEPSIAEVLDVWHTLKRGLRRTDPIFTAEPARVSTHNIKKIKAVRQSLAGGKTAQNTGVSKELVDFARSFFPEISMTTIEKNRLEIANCRSDRQKDSQQKNGYMTYMNLDKNGVITLYISNLKGKE